MSNNNYPSLYLEWCECYCELWRGCSAIILFAMYRNSNILHHHCSLCIVCCFVYEELPQNNWKHTDFKTLSIAILKNWSPMYRNPPKPTKIDKRIHQNQQQNPPKLTTRCTKIHWNPPQTTKYTKIHHNEQLDAPKSTTMNNKIYQNPPKWTTKHTKIHHNKQLDAPKYTKIHQNEQQNTPKSTKMNNKTHQNPPQ